MREHCGIWGTVPYANEGLRSDLGKVGPSARSENELWILVGDVDAFGSSLYNGEDVRWQTGSQLLHNSRNVLT